MTVTISEYKNLSLMLVNQTLSAFLASGGTYEDLDEQKTEFIQWAEKQDENQQEQYETLNHQTELINPIILFTNHPY